MKEKVEVAKFIVYRASPVEFLVEVYDAADELMHSTEYDESEKHALAQAIGWWEANHDLPKGER